MSFSLSETKASTHSDLITAIDRDHLPLQYLHVSDHILIALLHHYHLGMTVGDVVRAQASLVAIPGLGKADVKEVQDQVQRLIECSPAPVPPPQPSSLLDDPSDCEQSWNIPALVQALPLDHLQLTLPTQHALLAAHITTVGELVAPDPPVWAKCNLSASSLGELNAALVSLSNALDPTGDVYWPTYWKAQAIEVLPLLDVSNPSMEELIEAIPLMIQDILNKEPYERAWSIIDQRFGLTYIKPATLEEIGKKLRLTRERVRQREEETLETLQDVLLQQNYVGKRYHAHPIVHQLIEALREMVTAAPFGVLLDSMVQARIRSAFALNTDIGKPTLSLLFTLLGFDRITFDYPHAQAGWGCIEPARCITLRRMLQRLDDLLTQERALSLTEDEILVHLNSTAEEAEVLSAIELHNLIDLYSSVEKCEDGSLWAKFACLKGRGNQAERFLTEHGVPVHYREIAHEINQRLLPFGQRPITARSLSQLLSLDDRFLPIGCSGIWGLKAWSQLETRSIIKVMEAFLMSCHQPMTVSDIYSYVSQRRPTTIRSIYSYLHMEKTRFVRIGRATWGLVATPAAPEE